MDADLVLGLDLGTTRTKALLLDAAGTEVAVAAGPTPFASEGSRIEMPVDRLLQATEHVVASLGADRQRVAAVGLAGMAECGAPLDRSGAPVAPVIAWHDPRGTDVAERLVEQFGDALGLRTGQRPRSVSTVAKLGWLVANGTNALQRWLGVPELVLRSLTGTEVTEHSLASRTGCWDVVEMTWLEDVAAAAGFSMEVFGPVLPAGSAMGHIDAPTAERWGLPAGIPVTLAGHDHLAGAVGAGAGPGDLVNSVGTAETVLGTTTTAPDLRTALDLRTPVSVAPGGRGWVILAGAARAGVVLEAAAGRLGYGFGELDAMAEEAVPVDAADLVTSLQAATPAAFPDAAPGDIWLGLLRALAERTAEAARRVRTFVAAERLLVIGGGSGSRPWTRAKTELVGLPVLRPRTSQAVARGAAVMAGQAAGWWPSSDAAPKPGADPA
ncbi:MAG TPA: FGGY family carbohydrate kinase [Actinomycetota bacterium]|nr:FGGY family carbohydrate kinase [Actinomycetota bacterium]